MLKYFSIIFLSIISFAQVPKATFVKEVEVESKYIIWHSYVIDSTYWYVWNADGSLPKRENGTYLYWKADSSGNLIPMKKIDYRLPIFDSEPMIVNKEQFIFK